MASPPPDAKLIFGKGIMVYAAVDPTQGADPPLTFTTITNWELIPHFKGTINGPGGTSDIKDVTIHELSTPDSRLRMKAAGLADPGTLDGTIFFDPTHDVHKRMLSYWQKGTVCTYKMVLPPDTGAAGPPIVPAANYAFRGYVSQFKSSWPIDDYATCDLSFTFLWIDFNGVPAS